MRLKAKQKKKIWVAEGFTLFFFSFLFFIFFFCFRRYRLDYFHLSLFLFYFSGSGCYRFEQKLNAEFNSFQITT